MSLCAYEIYAVHTNVFQIVIPCPLGQTLKDSPWALLGRVSHISESIHTVRLSSWTSEAWRVLHVNFICGMSWVFFCHQTSRALSDSEHKHPWLTTQVFPLPRGFPWSSAPKQIQFSITRQMEYLEMPLSTSCFLEECGLRRACCPHLPSLSLSPCLQEVWQTANRELSQSTEPSTKGT